MGIGVHFVKINVLKKIAVNAKKIGGVVQRVTLGIGDIPVRRNVQWIAL
jgi:hypothetical protein